MILRIHGHSGPHFTQLKVMVYPDSDGRDKIDLSVRTEGMRFSSNKAMLVCRLIEQHGKKEGLVWNDKDGPVLYIDDCEEIIELLIHIHNMKSRLSLTRYRELAEVSSDLKEFKERLAPYIMETKLLNKP